MGARPGKQLHAIARVKQLAQAARDALPALHALADAAGTDVWGRYRVEAGGTLDGEDLAQWIDIARQEYPGRHVDVLLLVEVEPAEPTQPARRAQEVDRGTTTA